MKNWLTLALVTLMCYQACGMDSVNTYVLDDCPVECVGVSVAQNGTREHDRLIPIEQPQDNQDVPQVNDERPAIYLLSEVEAYEDYQKQYRECINLGALQRIIFLIEGLNFDRDIQPLPPAGTVATGNYIFEIENMYAHALAVTWKEFLNCTNRQNQDPFLWVPVSTFRHIIYHLANPNLDFIVTPLLNKLIADNNELAKFLSTKLKQLRSTKKHLWQRQLKQVPDFSIEHVVELLKWFLSQQLIHHAQLFPAQADRFLWEYRVLINNSLKNPQSVDSQKVNLIFQALASWRDVFVARNTADIQNWRDQQGIQRPLIALFSSSHLGALGDKLEQAGFDVQKPQSWEQLKKDLGLN